ncbi:MAG: hypothetical protein RLO81_19955 [Fulvivirga sp.]|uniref:hypothetical protein n=1 Tax=Fulvivirga sp. TaxID=1931237 RepID=UPI0032EBC8F0
MKLIIANVILLVILITYVGCEDDFTDKSGITTRIYGRMYDSENKIPIASQKLRISEYNKLPGSFHPEREFIQHLDSTFTDSEGYFHITFTTSGQGDLYILTYELNDIFNTKGQNSNIKVKEIGVDNEINFDFIHLYPVDLKISLDEDVQYLPIGIRPQFPPYYPSSTDLTQTGIELTRLIYTNKNSEQTIRFFRTTSEGQRQAAYIIMPATKVTQLTEFKITLYDGDFEDE